MASFRARLIRHLVALSGFKKGFSTPVRAMATTAKNRKKGPAEPGRKLHALCDIVESEVNGHRLFTAIPKEGGSGAQILYLHGGGYVLDLDAVHWNLITGLIQRTGASVSVPVYPLAPEHRWQDGFAMVRKVFDDLAAAHGAEQITVMGDSAGGGFTLALAQMLRDDGKPPPARLALLSPWLDATAGDPAQIELEKIDPIISLSGLRTMGKWWASELDPRDPRISPLFGTMEGLPPMAVWTGTHDLLLTDARRLREKAARAGADLSYHEYPEMLHVWMTVPMPEALKARDEIAVFMKG